MLKIKRLWMIVASGLLGAVSSCTQHQLKTPDLGVIYKEAAEKSDLYRNPVIVIPGVLGSKLTDLDSGQVVWGAFDNRYTSLSSAEKVRLVSLPIEQGETLRQLKDGIVSTEALDRFKFNLLGVPLQPQAYAPILATLGAGGYRDQGLALAGAVDYGDDHFTCFQFHYDWRRSNVENAAKLDAFIKLKRKEVRVKLREKYGVDRKNIKFDIVAHSMGGLVSRYYMRYGNQPLPSDGSLPKLTWAGAKNVEKVILVGTPNNGSVLAFEELLNGKDFAPWPMRQLALSNLPNYSPAVLNSFPSLFELMPRVRHRPFISEVNEPVNIYDVKLWQKYNWGILGKNQRKHLAWQLPNVKPEVRRAEAIEHLRKSLANAEQFHRSLDRKASAPKHLSITLISGDAITTKERIMMNSLTGKFRDNHYSAGDGIVLRSSVIADQRVGASYRPQVETPIDVDQVIFLPKGHLQLTKDTTFANNVLYKLLEE